MHWKTLFFVLGIFLSPCALCPGADGFVSLFDGETLTGWKPLPGGKWTVVDGAIVGSQEKTEKRHGQLFSEKEYGNFVVRLKFKALEGNSDFYFRAKRVDHVYAVTGFQAEIDSRGNNIGGLYETLGRAWVSKPKQETVETYYRAKEWNEMTVMRWLMARTGARADVGYSCSNEKRPRSVFGPRPFFLSRPCHLMER